MISSVLRVARTFFVRGMYDEGLLRDALSKVENYIEGKSPVDVMRGDIDAVVILEAANLLDSMSVDVSVVKRASPEILEDMNLVSSRLRRLIS